MKLIFITVGRIKEDYYRAALAEYEKRLSRYCEVSRIYIEEEKEDQFKLSKEGAKILAKVRGYFIVADIKGEMLSSEQLAERINDANNAAITVVVGGSNGLSDEVIKSASLRWSLSAATLPHSLANVAITEQIYRAFTINTGGKYHK